MITAKTENSEWELLGVIKGSVFLNEDVKVTVQKEKNKKRKSFIFSSLSPSQHRNLFNEYFHYRPVKDVPGGCTHLTSPFCTAVSTDPLRARLL